MWRDGGDGDGREGRKRALRWRLNVCWIQSDAWCLEFLERWLLGREMVLQLP